AQELDVELRDEQRVATEDGSVVEERDQILALVDHRGLGGTPNDVAEHARRPVGSAPAFRGAVALVSKQRWLDVLVRHRHLSAWEARIVRPRTSSAEAGRSGSSRGIGKRR